MKTFKDCCREVAEKNKLSFSGSNFYYIDDSITSVGNPLKFFEEAAELFVKEVALEFVNWQDCSDLAHKIKIKARSISPDMGGRHIDQFKKIDNDLFEAFRKEKGV